MALVKIYKPHREPLIIPAGAYVHQYAPHGWSLEPINDDDSLNISTDELGSDLADPAQTQEDYDPEPESITEEEESEEEDVEYVDPETLVGRPLDELDKDELEILAEYKGLDISNLTTVKALKAALKALE